MIRLIKILLFACLVAAIIPKCSSAQTCGFGCLGLGGFYAGYSFQQINAEGLNQSLIELDPSAPKFTSAKGFRLGANLFRTKYKSFLLTFKGYYQFLNEQQSVIIPRIESPATIKNSLDLNYWGVGFDGGISVWTFMDLKILDAQVTFHSAKLTVNEDGAETNPENVFRNTKTKVGFQVGSGLIFHLAGDYISFETTAAYSKFSIGEFQNDNGTSYTDTDLIKNGGLNLVVQLNIGIPLY